MMAKRRTSVSGGGADGGGMAAGRCFDPLFEFDAPQLFVDLTLPPKYHPHFPTNSSNTSSNGSLPPHDPWFDHVHAAHSKPSYELAQEEAAAQQKTHSSAEYGGTLNTSTISNSSSGANAGSSKHRPSGSSNSHRAKGTALNQSAALEKENRLAGPQRRANVAPALSTLSGGGNAGVGGLSNGATVNAGGGGSSSNNNSNVQQTRAALSVGSSASALGSIVSGPPARLRRKSALGGASGEGLSTGSATRQEPASVVRMRAPIKTTTAPTAAVTSDPLVRANGLSTDLLASRKRVLAAGGSAHHGHQRERSVPGTSTSEANAAQARARFMVPTASSRMAAAAAQKQTSAGTGGDAPRNGKTKTAPRRPAATATSSSAAGNSDLHDLQALLARHNKKFKATHTYQPPQHSVRDVRMWEKKTLQSYYTLSTEDRVKANSEIAQLVKAKAEEHS